MAAQRKRVSIIVTCFNNSRTATHMSMLCLDHIRKFTDREDYELIIMDPTPKFPIRDDYHTLDLNATDTNWIKLDQDPGYGATMHKGSEHASGDILVFLQNDVFVREGWLKDLVWYLDNGWEAVFPDQVPRTREYVTATYKRQMNHPDTLTGGRDAGCLMITRAAYDRTGGWNTQLGLLVEKNFYDRMGAAGVRWTDTNKVFITHIMAATNLELLDRNPEDYDRRMREDASKLNG